MEILKISAIALTGVLLAALLKSINKDISLYVILATTIIILLSIIARMSEIFGYMDSIYSNITYGREFFPIIIKVLVIAYIADFTSQICKDAGENAVGAKVEFAGKIIIFYISIPILTSILELIGTLLS